MSRLPIRLFLTFLILISLIQTAKSESIRLAILKYGTVNWEINVIKHHNLDKKYGVDLNITYLTNKIAASIALMSGDVDIIVTDWVWVSRQREEGEDFTLVPYSTAAGALMVPIDSDINYLEDLKTATLVCPTHWANRPWLEKITELIGWLARKWL